jgi:hypothetical protein
MTAYRDGVTVICELAAQFADAQWAAATPCGEWRASDLAGHLRCVADDYHEYLDDAPASRLARLMATGLPAETLSRKLARQNAAELAQLPDVSPREHIAAFAEAARSYGRRLPPIWDLPHHRYGEIMVSVGARSLGKDYRPADPDIVFAGWWEGMPHMRPGGEAARIPQLVLVADDAWEALLRASGRDPGWSA